MGFINQRSHHWFSPHCMNMYIYISADPGLGQGRGGAWDHRRCGTSPSSLSTVKPILQPSSHINSFCRLPALKSPNFTLHAANRHLAPQTLKTLQTLQTIQTLKTLQTLQNRKTLKTLTWHASSCSQPPPQGHTSMASYGHPSLPFASPLAANRHPRAIHQWLLPKATHQWLLLGIQVCRLPALLQPTGTPGPHINGFLWASKSAVCQPSNP